MTDRRLRIRKRAYEFWEAEGRQHGNDLAHWFRAEAEIPLRVTFDSNVWEDVVSPARRGDKNRQAQAIQVRNAIEAGELTGFFCEAWATLEGVTRQDRPDFHAGQSIKPQLRETDGTSSLAVFMGPDQSRRPPLEDRAAKQLDEAISLGLRLLMVPRDSQLDLAADFYVPHTAEIADRTQQALSAIEQRGVGRAMIRAFGLELVYRSVPPNGSLMFSDIPPDLPLTDDDRKKIARLVAEWADGEAVAAHIGYGNDIFCSEDFNKKRRAEKSVLDPEHRAWLSKEFGVRFATLSQLAEIVAS